MNQTQTSKPTDILKPHSLADVKVLSKTPLFFFKAQSHTAKSRSTISKKVTSSISSITPSPQYSTTPLPMMNHNSPDSPAFQSYYAPSPQNLVLSNANIGTPVQNQYSGSVKSVASTPAPPPVGNQTETLIADLKTTLETLESKYSKNKKLSGDCISLVNDENGENCQPYHTKKNRLCAFGSLTNNGLWRRDPFMRLMFTNLRALKKKLKAKVVKEPGQPSSLSSTKSKAFVGLKNMERQVKLRKKLTKKRMLVINNQTLKEKLGSMFPPRDIVDWHLRRFFDYIYPFCPVFDEYIVVNYSKRILQYNGDKVELQLDTKLDIIRAASLLMMLRLSYISLYLETETSNPITPKYDERILRHKIEADTVIMATVALERVNFLRKTSLEDMQLMMLLRLYQVLAPDDGDGGNYGDGTIYVGLLSSTALCLGLNRNACSKIKNEFVAHTPDSFRNLWSKIWLSCMQYDLELSVVYGKKPYIDPLESDALLPVADVRNSNLQSSYMDALSVQKLEKFMQIYPELYELTRSLHSLKGSTDIRTVWTRLNKIRDLTLKLYPINSPNGYLTGNADSLQAVNSITTRMVTGTFIMNICWVLMLHHEKQRDFDPYLEALEMAFSVAIEVSEITVDTFIKLFTTMSAHSLVLASYILQSVSKLLTFFLSLSVHIQLANVKAQSLLEGHAMSLEERSLRQNLLDQLGKLATNLISAMRLINKCLLVSMDHYYSSFRCYGKLCCFIGWSEKLSTHIMEYEDSAWKNCPNMIEKLSPLQVQKMNDQLERFLHANCCLQLQQRNRRWISASKSGLLHFSMFKPKISDDGEVVCQKENDAPELMPSSINDGAIDSNQYDGNGLGLADFDAMLNANLFSGSDDIENWLKTPDVLDTLDMIGEFGSSF